MAGNFNIIEDIGVLGTSGGWDIHLTRVSWYGRAPKYDIRPWDDDMETCGKGISLSDDQAQELLKLLKSEFED